MRESLAIAHPFGVRPDTLVALTASAIKTGMPGLSVYQTMHRKQQLGADSQSWPFKGGLYPYVFS